MLFTCWGWFAFGVITGLGLVITLVVLAGKP